MHRNERTVKKYFCFKCGKEINARTVFIFGIEKMSRNENGEIRNYMCSHFSENGLCLCSKCHSEINLFMKNEYPFDKTKREIELEKKLEEIAKEVTEWTSLFGQHIDVIRDYMGVVNKKVNGSAHEKHGIEDTYETSLKNLVKRFLDKESEE